MHINNQQEGSRALQPVKQKVRVYNPSLLSELLREAERAKQQQAQVRASSTFFSVLLRLQVAWSLSGAAACCTQSLQTCLTVALQLYA